MRNMDLASKAPPYIPEEWIDTSSLSSFIQKPVTDLYVGKEVNTCSYCNLRHGDNPATVIGDGAGQCKSSSSCEDPSFTPPINITTVNSLGNDDTSQAAAAAAAAVVVALPDIFVTMVKLFVDCEEGGIGGEQTECGSHNTILQAVKKSVPGGTTISVFEETTEAVFADLKNQIFNNERTRRRKAQSTSSSSSSSSSSPPPCGVTSKAFSLNFVDLEANAAVHTRNMILSGAANLLRRLRYGDKLICNVELLPDGLKTIDIPAMGTEENKKFAAGITQSLAATGGDGSVEVYPPHEPANLLGPNHPAIIRNTYIVSLDGFHDGDVLRIEARGSKPITNADGTMGTRTITTSLLSHSTASSLRYSSADAPFMIEWQPGNIMKDMLVFIRVTNLLTGAYVDSLMFQVSKREGERC